MLGQCMIQTYIGLRKIDVFGQPVSLKFNGRSRHQTEIGGLASIATIAIVFTFFSSNILGFMNKEELSVIVVNEFQEIPEITTIPSTTTVAVGFDSSGLMSYFNISMLQITIENQLITNQTIIQLEQCNITNFNLNTTSNSLDGHLIEEYLCLKPGQILILGQNATKRYELHLQISKCNRDECFEDNNINNQQYQAQLIFQNNMVNSMDVSQNYIQKFLDDTYSIKFVPNTFSKEQELYITQFDLFNDVSVLYADYHEDKTFVVDSRDSKQTVNIGENDVYASFIFKKNKLKTTIKRNYQKLADLLARLGGFLKISIFILGFAIQIYNKLQLYIILANKIYEFSFSSIKHKESLDQKLELLSTALQTRSYRTHLLSCKDEGSQQQLPPSRIKQKQNSIKLKESPILLPQSNQQIPLSSNGNETKKASTDEDYKLTNNLIENHILLAKKLNCQSGLDYFQKQINQIINRSKPLSLTFQILLNQIFCQKLFKKNISVKLYQKSMKEISSHLDVYYILQKLDELNKLKSILLTPQQMMVFNFTPKQMIAPDNNELKFNRNFLEEKARNRHATLLSDTPVMRKRASQESENLIYQRIYNAYDGILQQLEGDAISQPQDVNRELIKKLGVELQTIFKVSKMIDFEQVQNIKSSRKIARRNAQLDQEIQVTNMMQQFYQL